MDLARSSLASCEIVCQPARIFAFGLVDGSSTHPSFRDFALSNRVSHNLVQWYAIIENKEKNVYNVKI